MPVNAKIYDDEMIKIIEFRLLNPDGIIGLFIPGFKLTNWIKGTMKGSSDTESNMLDDMFVYILVGGVFLLVVAVMITLMVIKPCRNKIKAKLVQIKNKTLFNGIIRSIIISYLGATMSACKQISYWIEQDEGQENSQIITAVSMLVVLLLIPILFMVFLYKNREDLKT